MLITMTDTEVTIGLYEWGMCTYFT